jgi:hypothetical protein
MMQGSMDRLAPLVEELNTFCEGHRAGDGGRTAEQMLAQVRELWPDVPERQISSDPDPEADPEVLALRIIRDVGDAAERLLRIDPQKALGWSRANLVVDLERYLEAVGGR